MSDSRLPLGHEFKSCRGDAACPECDRDCGQPREAHEPAEQAPEGCTCGASWPCPLHGGPPMRATEARVKELQEKSGESPSQAIEAAAREIDAEKPMMACDIAEIITRHLAPHMKEER